MRGFLGARRGIVLGMFAVVWAAVVGWVEWRTRNLRRENADLAAECRVLAERREVLEREAEALRARGELASGMVRSNLGEPRGKDEGRVRGGDSLEAQHLRPPARLPMWEAESPYVWIRKEAVPMFSIRVFDASGGLSSEMAEILDLSPEVEADINRTLEDLGRRLEQWERTNAVVTKESGAEVGVTVKVPPLGDAATEWSRELEEFLRSKLGPHRFELVKESAAAWWDERFGTAGRTAKVYTVKRHTDGTWNVSGAAGGTWRSVGGVREWASHIPRHLAELFEFEE